MREFYLINSLGQKTNLNSSDAFLSDPEGMGQEHDVDYVKTGNFFVKTEDLLAQKKMSGTIIFKGYEEFADFSKFIQHKPLTLEYTASGTYRMAVSIDKLEKGELGTLGLESKIDMRGLTTWYRVVNAENAGETEEGKKYPFSYPFTYTDTTLGEIQVECDSTLDCPCKITILGPCTNPSWTHYANGKLTLIGKVGSTLNPCVIQTGNRLIVDATKIPYEIAEYDNTGTFVQDLYQLSDFSTERFVIAKYGTNKITFTHEGAGELKLLAEMRVDYESV